MHRYRSVRWWKLHTAQRAVEEIAFLEIGQQVEKASAKHAITNRWIVPNARRKMPMLVMKLEGGQAELLKIVHALRPAGRFSRRLDRRQ